MINPSIVESAAAEKHSTTRVSVTAPETPCDAYWRRRSIIRGMMALGSSVQCWPNDINPMPYHAPNRTTNGNIEYAILLRILRAVYASMLSADTSGFELAIAMQRSHMSMTQN